MDLIFTVEGKVKAKQSFKFTQNGRRYTPSDIIEYSNLVKLSFIHKYPNWDMKEYENKPLRMEITVFMKIPKSFSKKKQNDAMLDNIRPIVKPDCDNISKNICDSLNGIVYPDDKQICELLVRKKYAEREFVIIGIEEM